MASREDLQVAVVSEPRWAFTLIPTSYLTLYNLCIWYGVVK